MNDCQYCKIGQIRVHPETGTVAVYRNGNDLTGPMWFVVPVDDDPRWQLVADGIHEWPVVFTPEEHMINLT